MKFNEDQTELFRIFSQILVYGYGKLQSVPLNERKVKPKKKILYLMMGAVQSFSEAILKLVSPPKIYDKAAEVVYRSLAETLINLQYIFASPNQDNALKFMIFTAHDNIDFATKYKQFILSHPGWNMDFGQIRTTQDWENFVQETQDKIDEFNKLFNVQPAKNLPDLKGRAQSVDRFYKTKRKRLQKINMESFHVRYYKFFSQITHLTMPGLERFLVVTPTSRKVILDGTAEDFSRIAAITYILYWAVLRFFLQEFKVFDKAEFKPFEDYSKKYTK